MYASCLTISWFNLSIYTSTPEHYLLQCYSDNESLCTININYSLTTQGNFYSILNYNCNIISLLL